MADVYLAVSRVTPGFERLAVIKRLRADLLVEDDDNPQDAAHFIAMFRDEARLAILLKHANIVHTYDVFEDKDKLYLVMEYIEGQSLSAIQRLLAKTSRKLPVDQAAVVIAEILGGLHYAHELKDYSGQPLNIVHRDVSPQNILVGYDGTIKLVDFGVAKVNFRSTQTRAGTMKGKARYMAPEQVTNKGVDRRADVYSAGVMLWELVAGKKLVNGANMYEQLVNVLKTPSPPLSSIVPDVDPALEAIVAKALSREPGDRFDTAAQMQDALRAFVSRTTGARGEDVGGFVAKEFETQRAQISKVIGERMSAEQADSGTRPLESEASAIAVFVELDQADEHVLSSGGGANSHSGSGSGSRSYGYHDSTGPASGSGSRSVPSAAMPTTTQVSGVPPHFSVAPAVPPVPEAQEERKKPVPWLMIGAAAALVLVAFGGGALMTRKPAESTVIGPASSPTPSPPTPVVATVVPTAVAPAPKETASKPPEPPVTATVARPAPVAAPPPPARPAYAWSPPPPAPRPAPPKEDSTAASSSATEAPGFLTMDTYPWTRVSVDGKVVGSTPLVHFALAPGVHSVAMDNPAENVHQSTSVVIKSGETISKRLAFDAK
jgi:serine/threonine-protein kinase